MDTPAVNHLRRVLVALAAMWLLAPALDARAACPPDCSGQTLQTPNFAHMDLTNAKFDGATIIGGVFVRAKLDGASFAGATFAAVPGHPTQTPDFTFASLRSASFAGAKFNAPTYFTHADITCADFSQTDLVPGNAVFGDDALVYSTGESCRTKFRGTTMSCEFIDDWRSFDLTGADVSACASRLAGRNFTGALMSGVKLDNAILDGATFVGANLTQAQLNGASLQCLPAGNGGNPRCVDLSQAQLQGAKLHNANLSGASLYGAFLSNNVNDNITEPASLHQAHLKNVNLSFAQLSGVDLEYVNFYGNVPANNANGCGTTASNYAGFTNGCASAHHATMTGTRLLGAYLYGVDFSEAAIAGVNFTNAVLAGANFAGATITTNASSSEVTEFFGAYLQGTNLDQAKLLAYADFSNAFFDFRSGGNLIYVSLDGSVHNAFACSTPSTCRPPSGENVCVWVRYPTTTVPAGNTTITCPDGSTGRCGAADPSGGNTKWQSKFAIGNAGQGPPAGWYSNAATYTVKAPDAAVCLGNGPSAHVLNW
jgi:uncharacterized protein YjbI with pentapeptide repeats